MAPDTDDASTVEDTAKPVGFAWLSEEEAAAYRRLHQIVRHRKFRNRSLLENGLEIFLGKALEQGNEAQSDADMPDAECAGSSAVGAVILCALFKLKGPSHGREHARDQGHASRSGEQG